MVDERPRNEWLSRNLSDGEATLPDTLPSTSPRGFPPTTNRDHPIRTKILIRYFRCRGCFSYLSSKRLYLCTPTFRPYKSVTVKTGGATRQLSASLAGTETYHRCSFPLPADRITPAYDAMERRGLCGGKRAVEGVYF